LKQSVGYCKKKKKKNPCDLPANVGEVKNVGQGALSLFSCALLILRFKKYFQLHNYVMSHGHAVDLK